MPGLSRPESAIDHRGTSPIPARRGLAALRTIAVAACSCSSSTPTPIGERPLDQRAIERLLTTSDVADVGGRTAGLDRSIEDILVIASSVGLAPVDGVEVWFSVRFGGEGRPSLLLSVKRFTETSATNGALDRIETGGVYAAMVDPIGESSARALVDPSIGATLTFAHAGTLITLQVPAASHGATLLDDAQHLALAELVASRL